MAMLSAMKTDPAPAPPRKRSLLRRLLLVVPVAIAGLVAATLVGSRRPTVEPTVRVGDQAPDWAFTTAEGASVALSSLWSQAPLVVIWLRHYG